MLKKLLKQEMKITSRTFLPMYFCFIMATLLLKLSFFFSQGDAMYIGAASSVISLFQALMIFIYVVLLIGTILLTYFIIIKRFYSNMFGDEGYLMFTLPVTTKQLLNSKIISALIWMLILAPMTIGSFLLLFLNTDTYNTVMYYLSYFAEEFQILQTSGFHIGLLIVELLIAAILGVLSSLLMFYLSMTMGHHFFSEHRLLGSIGFYLIFSTIESALESITGTITEDLLWNFMSTSNVADLYAALNRIIPISMLLSIVLIFVYYFVTHYFLDKKLNLS